MPDDGLRHELVEGELRTMPPSGFEHSAIGVGLAGLLAAHVKKNALGIVSGADGGFIIGRDPDTVRAPDVGFVRQSRIPASGVTKKFHVGAPDLAVEVMSPGDTVYEVDEKVQQWLSAGTAMVVVVNPKQKTVAVYRPPGNAKILSVNDTFEGDDVVPGFQCPVKEMFV